MGNITPKNGEKLPLEGKETSVTKTSSTEAAGRLYFWSLQVSHLIRHIVSYLLDFSASAFPPMQNHGVTFFANSGTKRAASIEEKLKVMMIRLSSRHQVIDYAVLPRYSASWGVCMLHHCSDLHVLNA